MPLVCQRYVKEISVTRWTTKTFVLAQVFMPPQYITLAIAITFHGLIINVKPTSVINLCSVKVKVAPWHDSAGTERRQRYGSIPFATSALEWGWMVSSAPRPLYLGEGTGTYFTESCVGLGAGLEGYGNSRPHRDSTPVPSSPWRVAVLTTLSRPPICTVRTWKF
jgi:hypothetical protein